MLQQIVELVKFGFWGAVSTGINLALFFLFEKGGMPYIVANIVSYIGAVVVSYYFNKYFVFNVQEQSNREDRNSKIKYYAMRCVSVAIDSCLLYLLHEVCGLGLMPSKVLDSVIIISSTFVLSKTWVYASHRESK